MASEESRESGTTRAVAGLVLAVLVGAGLRLIWPADIEYKSDEQWTFEQVRAVLAGGPWPSLGMPTSLVVPNPPMSAWVFVGLGKLFAVRTPPDLASAVQVLNIVAIVGFVVFARVAIAAGDRERWYWAAALWSLNPLAIVFERKIWPPSVLPPFMIAILACWWFRRRPIPAFAWGALGATVGQVHSGAWFLTLALLIWTLLDDRRSTHWRAWLLGNVAAAWPAVPWLVDLALNGSDRVPLQWRTAPLAHYFIRWITQPFGLGIDYVLGPVDTRAFLAGPAIAGRPTYAMGLVFLVLVFLFLAIAIASARHLQRIGNPEGLPPPTGRWSIRGLVIGRDNEGVLLRAACWGWCSAPLRRWPRHVWPRSNH